MGPVTVARFINLRAVSEGVIGERASNYRSAAGRSPGLICVLVCAALVASCGVDVESRAEVQRATATAAEASRQAAVRARWTATASLTPSPTVTPSPTPTPTATATATLTLATETPVAARPAGNPFAPVLLGGPVPPADCAPSSVRTATDLRLTGLSRRGPGLRPLVVQIDNAIPARPTLNLSEAEIVYESVAEGGVTRFSALYTREDVGTVGPVRSARLISLEVARQFEATLVYHGASAGVQQRIWNGGIYFVSFNAPDSFGIHGRLASRPAPHNSITTLRQVRAYATAHGTPPQVEWWPDFPRAPLAVTAGAEPATALSIGFAGPDGAPANAYRANFGWDAPSGRYVRSVGGSLDVDSVTGRPISAASVVVQIAPVVITDIVEDVYGSRSLDYQILGEGPAHFFRDGQHWAGCWRRAGAFEPSIFIARDGSVFPLAPGPVWIAVAAPNTPVGWRAN